LHSTHASPFSNLALYRNFGFIVCQIEILKFDWGTEPFILKKNQK
jgi:hypothetical protein